MRYFLCVAVADGGGAREGLYEVERGSLSGQQAAGGAAQREQKIICLQCCTILRVPGYFYCRVQLLKYRFNPGLAAKYTGFPRNNSSFCDGIFINQLRGDVAIPDIFCQRLLHAQGYVVFKKGNVLSDAGNHIGRSCSEVGVGQSFASPMCWQYLP